MKKQKNKFVAKPFILFGMSLLLILGIFTLSLTFVILPESNVQNSNNFIDGFIIFMCGVLPTLIFISQLNQAFSIVTIDAKGIHKSLFGRFLKVEFPWNEIDSMMVINRVDTWLFISKVDMKGLDYYKLLKHKDIIQVGLRPDLLKVIRTYTDMEIENYGVN